MKKVILISDRPEFDRMWRKRLGSLFPECSITGLTINANPIDAGRLSSQRHDGGTHGKKNQQTTLD